MIKQHSRRWLSLFCALISLAFCGCDKEDSERLARVWHRAESRVVSVTGGVRSRLADGWHSIQSRSTSPAALRERVAARLRMDKALAGSTLEVEVDGTKVTLRGEAPDAATKKRAVELAEGTLGVEEVADEMTAKE